MAAIIDALGFPDTSLAAKVYLVGFPIVGTATDTGLWRQRSTSERLRSGPKITVDELRSSNLKFTQQLLTSLPQQFAAAQKRGDNEWLRLHELTWKATIDEVNVKKSARGPVHPHPNGFEVRIRQMASHPKIWATNGQRGPSMRRRDTVIA